MAAKRRVLPPWITEDGCFEPMAYPVDDILAKALSEEDEAFRMGCNLLQMRVHRDDRQALVILLGLFRWYADDLDRLKMLVDAVRYSRTEVVASLLVSELRRVESTNATRGYLNELLKALARFPDDLVTARFDELADDRHFSERWRSKFRRLARGEPL